MTATIERLKQTLPEGVEVTYPYDTTPFVTLSIEKVVHTLFEAIILVFIVMYVFLQNLRATFIPVSYTHLDVYKRQIGDLQSGA